MIAPGARPREVKNDVELQRNMHRGGARRGAPRLVLPNTISVEMVNVSGTVDQILEALASGKVDAGYGMAWVWLKPLEQGFDVKLIAQECMGGMHLRLLTATQGSGTITSVSSLRTEGVKLLGLSTCRGARTGSSCRALASKRCRHRSGEGYRMAGVSAGFTGVALQKGRNPGRFE